MEFMDFTADIDTNVGSRSRRVRSWYLNEHVKSLENKRCASASISKLENKHYQDRMLQKELAERRMRRRLYDHPDDTESQLSHSLANEDSENISRENLYESICSFEDEDNKYRDSEEHKYLYDRCEQNCNTFLTEDVPIIQYEIHDCSYEEEEEDLEQNEVEVELTEIKSAIPEEKSIDKSSESVKSVIKLEEQVKDKYEESVPVRPQLVKKEQVVITPSLDKQPPHNFSPNNTAQLNMRPVCNKPVKQTVRKSETKASDYITPSEEYLLNRLDCDSMFGKGKQDYVRNIWSKVVSFAYQLVKCNQGIIYDDYSAQIMTAVLACEVVRRGVTKICDMLQPYVSPIKYSSESDLNQARTLRGNQDHLTKRKRKKFAKPRKKCSYSRYKRRHQRCENSVYDSEVSCNLMRAQPYALRPNYLESWGKSEKWSNEPWDRLSESLTKHNTTSSSTSLWPFEINTHCGTRPDLYNRTVENPMLKLVTYVDEILLLDKESGPNNT